MPNFTTVLGLLDQGHSPNHCQDLHHVTQDLEGLGKTKMTERTEEGDLTEIELVQSETMKEMSVLEI